MSAYAAPRWLPDPHLHTIWGSLCTRVPKVAYRRERWETPDGDFVDLDFVDGPDPHSPYVLLLHGLEGSSASPYARALMAAVAARGGRGAVLNFRGCSGELNRRPRAYHSGDSAELDWLLPRLRELATVPLWCGGVSLGGNVLLKWLGERRGAARALVAAAAAVSAPVDLNAAGDALERGAARIYTAHFLRSLKPQAAARLRRFPGIFDGAAARRARTLRQFDDAVTAPLHGFVDAADYWTRSSSKPGLRHVEVPTLLLNAEDDPFLPAAALPRGAELSKAITAEYPRQGGHVAFVSGWFPGGSEWLPRRLLSFWDAAAG